MAKHSVVTMPGDGIGNQVLPEALRVLNAVGFDAEYIHADIGWDSWRNQGNALPQHTIDLLTKHKLGLFGAITSKPNKEAQAELKPELQGKGLVYYSPIVTMRQKFNLDICMRPCIGFSGNPLNYIRPQLASQIQSLRQRSRPRHRGERAHHHSTRSAPHRYCRLRLREEARLQRCDHLRKTQRGS